jgi:hypothetical protein
LYRIAERGFENCCSIESIRIPAAASAVGSFCFAGCRRLSEVIFEPNSEPVAIDTGAFQYCSSLQSFHLPASVTFIDELVFLECISLDRITFHSPSSRRELLYFPPAATAFMKSPIL